MQRIVLASNNPAKVEELRALLLRMPFEVVAQSELGIRSVEETAPTFVENAILKARYAASQADLPAIADDSGLEVDALDGAPGVYSARYAGAAATDASNNAKLLAALEGLPDAERGARFFCAVVYLRHAGDPTPIICTGDWRGRILAHPRGDNGFGYDPLFYAPRQHCASAELPTFIKNRVSHRARALRRLSLALKSIRHGA